MIRLAQNYNHGSLSLGVIAKEEKISLGYLERLAAKLKICQLVKSSKGVNGGYVLSRSPKNISVKEIFEALEGTIAPFYCAEPKNFCGKKDCLAKLVWQKLDKEIKRTLDKITLSELVR